MVEHLEYHDVANLFPLMQGEEYENLKADIAANGLREPIWLHEGKIVDGRNRHRACLDTGTPPRYRTWDGNGSLVAFVVSLNLQRRHLTSSQKAVVALEVEKALAEEATAKEAERKRNQGDTTLEIFPKSEPIRAADQAAKILGTNAHYVTDAKRLAATAPELLDEVRDGNLTIPEAKALARLPEVQRASALTRANNGDARNVKDAIRKTRLEEQVAAIEGMPTPTGKHHVIVADPPWAYEKRAEDATHRGACPYPTMAIDEICAMPVADLALDDCVLWLWTTNAFMEEAYQVAQAWGFEVKTILTWAKDRMGVGDWLRGQTEHCLMAVKGRPVVRLTNQTTLLHGPMREHSRKPDEFYRMVEALCPGSKCELFSREQREGWANFGAEVGLFYESEF